MLEATAQFIRENLPQVHGLKIVQGENVLFRECFGDDKRYPIYSVAKSFTSTAFGIAHDEGKLAVNEPIYQFLEKKYLDKLSANQLESFKKLTFKRFITMSVKGFPFRPSGDDWVEFALSCPIDYSTAQQFSYSNISAYLVAVACENAVGEHLIKYMTPRLFEPLGIEKPTFQNCPKGHFYGATGMELTLDELSRLGQLYLNGGTFGGRRIVSESWVNEAVTPRIKTDDGGYGYFFRTYNNCFSAVGKWGQKSIVFKDKGLVITYLSDLKNGDGEMFKIAREIGEKFSD